MGSNRGQPGSYWNLSDGWKIEPEKIIAMQSDADLKLNFTARKVFLVMGAADNKPIKVDIILDGKAYKTITVDHNKLYTLL